MLLNVEIANTQIVQLTRQIAAVRYAAGGLSRYRNRLQATWFGDEARQYDCIAAELVCQCEVLEEQLTIIQKDIIQAMEDILLEQSELLL